MSYAFRSLVFAVVLFVNHCTSFLAKMGKQVEDDCQYMEQFIVFFFFDPLEGSPFHSINSHPCLPKFESETPYWKSQVFTAGASP